MNTNRMKILFWLRKAKLNKSGLCPIVCTITVNGKQLDFSTGIMLAPKDWDNDKKKASKTESLANRKLTQIQAKFDKLHADAEIAESKLTAQQVRDYLQGKPLIPTQTKITLLATFQAYIDNLESYQGTGRELAPDTIRIWRTRLINTAKYLQTYQGELIELAEVRPKMAYEMEAYFVKELRFSLGYASRIIEGVRSVYDYAIEREIVKENPFRFYESKENPSHKYPHLDLVELEAIQTAELDEKYNPIRDTFLLLCYTGLLHSDFLALTDLSISIDSEGTHWLEGKRVKANKKQYGEYCLPLHPIVMTIIEKHKDNPLPPFSLEYVNRQLKIIQAVCRIKKNLSTRLGRTTFAYHALNTYGIDAVTVARMMGHSSIQTTLNYYTKVNKEKIRRDVKW